MPACPDQIGPWPNGFCLARPGRLVFAARSMTAKTALVTGASRGIGRGIAVELARAGCRVAINYAGNAEAAAEALRLVRAAGGDGFVIQGDIAASADRARLVG